MVTTGKMKCHMVGSRPSVHSEKFIPPPNAINMSAKASAMAWMFFARNVICVSAFSYFDLWTYDGMLERIHHALYEQCS